MIENKICMTKTIENMDCTICGHEDWSNENIIKKNYYDAGLVQ